MRFPTSVLRYCADRALPVVPHRSGNPHPVPSAVCLSDTAAELRFAADLFNHGYYWEAHEIWERRWMISGRMGAEADLWKGLIRLAAAGVKEQQGRAAGIARHTQRAMELLRQAQRSWTDSCSAFPAAPLWDAWLSIAETAAHEQRLQGLFLEWFPESL